MEKEKSGVNDHPCATGREARGMSMSEWITIEQEA